MAAPNFTEMNSRKSLKTYCVRQIQLLDSKFIFKKYINSHLTTCVLNFMSEDLQTLWHVPLGARINGIPLYFEFELFFTRLHFVIAITFCYFYYITNSLHLGRKYTRIFFRGHYLFRVAHSFPRATLSENCSVSYAEQIMSAEKYPSIFSAQMEAIVFIILQIYFATRTVLINWGIL